jgi:preprotein translocase subunit SecF
MLKIIQKRKIWLSLSGSLVVISIIFLFMWGLKYGIDFTGGSMLNIKFVADRPSNQQMQDAVKDLDLGGLIVQPVGDKEAVFRFQSTDSEKHKEAVNKLKQLDANLEELSYNSIGPSIGNELKRKAFNSIFFVIIAIVLYIAWAFRKVSKPITSWKYGLAAIVALFHDVIITLGFFSFLGEFYGVEINTPFVAAILTVLGYSVMDSIVVFDRIRENIPKSYEDFENTINTSVNQTMRRSIYTSSTAILVLLSIVFFGGASIRDFALALTIGIFIGTYSSIFVASPTLVVWENLRKKKQIV